MGIIPCGTTCSLCLGSLSDPSGPCPSCAQDEEMVQGQRPLSGIPPWDGVGTADLGTSVELL